MGQQMVNVGNSTRKTENGFVSNITFYQAKNCSGCPLRGQCHQAKGNRQIEINHQLNRYRQKARELLTSQKGVMHRKRRPIEPEAVFGQTKANKQYNRFRHFSGDKVKMDFAIFAIAFNIGKMYNKPKNTSKKQEKPRLFDKNQSVFVLIIKLWTYKKWERKNVPIGMKLAA